MRGLGGSRLRFLPEAPVAGRRGMCVDLCVWYVRTGGLWVVDSLTGLRGYVATEPIKPILVTNIEIRRLLRGLPIVWMEIHTCCESVEPLYSSPMSDFPEKTLLIALNSSNLDKGWLMNLDSSRSHCHGRTARVKRGG
jgi:hypothetical protein